ncbi:MAG TPA: TIGR00266 family protein [Pirellulales bacterium]|nr:TIGR00266 family protein [Pirellulales bacterium]
MDYEVQHGPVFTVVEFKFNEAEEVVAQPNSMISMTPGIQISASIGSPRSGMRWVSGFKSLLGGESFFRAVFRAKRDEQALLLAPDNYGQILPLPITDAESLYLSRGAYLAHFGDCKLEIKYGGLKGVMAKTGLFLLRVSGSGMLFCQTYGAIVHRMLAEDEQFLIDNRYVVAFSDSITYELVKSSERIRDSLMSGEGFINRFTGPGQLIYQTRAKPAANFLGTLLSAVT